MKKAVLDPLYKARLRKFQEAVINDPVIHHIRRQQADRVALKGVVIKQDQMPDFRYSIDISEDVKLKKMIDDRIASLASFFDIDLNDIDHETR